MLNPHYYLLIGGISTVLAGAGMSGCSYYHARQTGRTTTQVADDKRISDRVVGSLKMSPVYKFPEVGVRTFDRFAHLDFGTRLDTDSSRIRFQIFWELTQNKSKS